MAYALVDVELTAPRAPVRLGPDERGVALVSRRQGRVVGFALHDATPGAALAPEEVDALLDPAPGQAPEPSRRPAPSITVAICTRDRPALLDACLGSLVAGGVDPARVLVVDNAPPDDRTAEVARRHGVTHVVEPCPGLDAARNRALRVADTEVVAFVDDDVLVDAHWIEGLAAAWADHPDAWAICGQILPAELETDAQVAFERRGGFRRGNHRVRFQGQDLGDNPAYPYGFGFFGAGANLSVRRVEVLRLGGFDEALDTGPPLPGGGDSDLTHRVVRAGAPLVYEPGAVVFHRHRRDAEGLRRQYDSWGRSAMAVVAKTWWADPPGRPKLRLFVRWFTVTHATAALRGLAHPSTEADAARAELRGGLAGLLGTYGRSRRRSGRRRRAEGRPMVAILPWGHVLDDYLDPLGLDLDDFADQQAGGWLFGCAEALGRAGVDTTIICWTRQVARPTRRVHLPTGAVLWLLPPARAYAVARRRLQDPYAASRRRAIGASGGSTGLAQLAYLALPYLTTTPRALARVLRQEGCRAVLCQEYEEGRFDVCVALGRVLRLPVLATFQGGDRARTPLERLLRPRTVRAARRLLVGSSSEVRRIEERYGVEPGATVRVANPFDPATVPLVPRREAREALGIAPEADVVAWHGRVDIDAKGLDTLLEAWCRVRATASADPARPLVLLLLGTGAGAPWLHERIATLGLPDVCWRDEYVLDRRVIGTHLSAADLYVLPSRREGFPVAPIEAMVAGLPVVAADAPGVREVVGEGVGAGGVVVPVDDAAALAGAIRGLLDDPERRRETGAAAARRVADRFSLDAVGRQLRDVVVGA